MSLETFRLETRNWLADNCPPGARGPGEISNGSTKIDIKDSDTRVWIERMVEKGWTVPSWPKAYGGGGLSTDEVIVLLQEMKAISARPALSSFGTSMIGPTLLEYGTEEQKQRHLPRIARAEVEWCQGYSEPGSGSDLASLQTRAVLEGDQFIINGQKTWTSGAHNADWMFILVRTDKDAPKHEGISFMLLPMDQPGVDVRPIPLISGVSTFNDTFFDNAVAARNDLVGELNRGWTVGKRLLQHERSGMESLLAGSTSKKDESLLGIAKEYLGVTDGKLAEPLTRDEIVTYQMNSESLQLTRKRVVEETQSGATPGPATSIFKVISSELEQKNYDLITKVRGSRGFGVDELEFSEQERAIVKQFFFTRAASI
ncbi:MAG: acyl-CoA dehydrogenase family protein, partial [Pseudomonadales bacterium]|nr:acyl-CoA dehydrogenase family protein [Pseudomonadales bacterium]